MFHTPLVLLWQYEPGWLDILVDLAMPDLTRSTMAWDIPVCAASWYVSGALLL